MLILFMLFYGKKQHPSCYTRAIKARFSNFSDLFKTHLFKQCQKLRFRYSAALSFKPGLHGLLAAHSRAN